MVAVMALMEAPAIIIAVILMRLYKKEDSNATKLSSVIKHSLTNGIVILILGSLVIGFMVSRAVLALGEAGNFPGAIKATAEYFPKKERSFATGIFNSGANVGAILAPLTVPWISKYW